MNKFYILLLLIITQSIQPIPIKIITEKNKTIEIDAQGSDTIEDIQKKIATKINIPAREQILVARYMYMSLTYGAGMSSEAKLSDILKKQWNFDKVPVYVMQLSPEEANAPDQLTAIKEKIENLEKQHAPIEQLKQAGQERKKYSDLIYSAEKRAIAFSESKITKQEQKQRNIGESKGVQNIMAENQARYDKLAQEVSDLKGQLPQADPSHVKELKDKISDIQEIMDMLTNAINSNKKQVEQYQNDLKQYKD